MLTVRFRQEGEHLALSMDGHATGSVAACAGASALACALAGWLDRYGAEATCVLEPGRARIRCRDTERARSAFALVAVGLTMLAEEHPGRIEIPGGTTGVFPAGMW